MYNCQPLETNNCCARAGSWLCEETRCSPGLLPRGLLDLENDPQCQANL